MTKTTFKETYFGWLNEVRQSYKKRWNGKKYQYPYKFDRWFEMMTPTERNVWNIIRSLGLPFYGQFPVGKYVVDFADPFKKIIIEVDGKIHNKNSVKANDKIRQKELEKQGWKVVRIQGWKTYSCIEDFFLTEEERLEFMEVGEEIPKEGVRKEFWTNSAEGILMDLRSKYYWH